MAPSQTPARHRHGGEFTHSDVVAMLGFIALLLQCVCTVIASEEAGEGLHCDVELTIHATSESYSARALLFLPELALLAQRRHGHRASEDEVGVLTRDLENCDFVPRSADLMERVLHPGPNAHTPLASYLPFRRIHIRLPENATLQNARVGRMLTSAHSTVEFWPQFERHEEIIVHVDGDNVLDVDMSLYSLPSNPSNVSMPTYAILLQYTGPIADLGPVSSHFAEQTDQATVWRAIDGDRPVWGSAHGAFLPRVLAFVTDLRPIRSINLTVRHSAAMCLIASGDIQRMTTQSGRIITTNAHASFVQLLPRNDTSWMSWLLFNDYRATEGRHELSESVLDYSTVLRSTVIFHPSNTRLSVTSLLTAMNTAERAADQQLIEPLSFVLTESDPEYWATVLPYRLLPINTLNEATVLRTFFATLYADFGENDAWLMHALAQTCAQRFYGDSISVEAAMLADASPDAVPLSRMTGTRSQTVKAYLVLNMLQQFTSMAKFSEECFSSTAPVTLSDFLERLHLPDMFPFVQPWIENAGHPVVLVDSMEDLNGSTIISFHQISVIQGSADTWSVPIRLFDNNRNLVLHFELKDSEHSIRLAHGAELLPLNPAWQEGFYRVIYTPSALRHFVLRFSQRQILEDLRVAGQVVTEAFELSYFELANATASAIVRDYKRELYQLSNAPHYVVLFLDDLLARQSTADVDDAAEAIAHIYRIVGLAMTHEMPESMTAHNDDPTKVTPEQFDFYLRDYIRDRTLMGEEMSQLNQFIFSMLIRLGDKSAIGLAQNVFYEYVHGNADIFATLGASDPASSGRLTVDVLRAAHIYGSAYDAYLLDQIGAEVRAPGTTHLKALQNTLYADLMDLARSAVANPWSVLERIQQYLINATLPEAILLMVFYWVDVIAYRTALRVAHVAQSTSPSLATAARSTAFDIAHTIFMLQYYAIFCAVMSVLIRTAARSIGAGLESGTAWQRNAGRANPVTWRTRHVRYTYHLLQRPRRFDSDDNERADRETQN